MQKSHSRRRKIIPEGDRNIHKGNANYMGKFIIQFSYHFKIKNELIKYNNVVCPNTKGKNKMYDNKNTEVGR